MKFVHGTTMPALLVVLAGCAAWADNALLDPAAVGRALRAHIVQTVGCSEEDVQIRSAGSVEGASIPAGEVRILLKSVPATYRNLLVGVEVSLEDKPLRTFWVTVDASVRGRLARARRRIPFGTTLTTADVEIVDGEIPDLRATYFKTEQEILGRVARRLIMAGDPLSADVLVAPYLVRSGQTVRLRVERDRVTAAALVRAEQDGRLGQTVTVRNLDFSRRLKARVVGPGEVKID